MNIRLKRIRLENFKSFRGEHDISLTRQPGLHFITGVNEADTKLGANGVGKSTLFDAMFYALFGKTVRGLRADNIVTKGETNCYVSLTIECDGVDMEFVRKRESGRNTFTIDGEETDAANHTAFAGLNETLFRLALIRGQFSLMFFDMSPAEQLEILDEVLHLDFWLDASARAKEAQEMLQTCIDDLNHKLTAVNASIESCEAELTREKGLSADYEAIKQRRVVEKDAEVARRRGALAAARSALTDYESKARRMEDTSIAETRVAETKKALDAAAEEASRLEKVGHKVDNTESDRIQSDIDTRKKNLTESKTKLDEVRGELQAKSAIIGMLSDQQICVGNMEIGSSCPTCLQPITREHAESCLKDIGNKLSDAAAEKKAIEVTRLAEAEKQVENDVQTILNLERQKQDAVVAENDAASEKLERYNAAVGVEREALVAHSSAKAELEAVKTSGQNAMLAVEAAKNAVSHAVDALKVAEKARREAAEAENPHLANIKHHESTAARLAAQKSEIVIEREGREKGLGYAQYWVKGFKQIRLYVIERSVLALELEVNNSLAALGMGNYTVHIDPVKQNKSGTVSHRLSLSVLKGDSKDAQPLAAFSGGEYQRLRLACELGLSNLILTSRGMTTDFEIWDEPTEHLSVEGIENLMSCLKARGIEKGRAIWMIDHTARSFPFDTVLNIHKSDEGSYVN